jgi:Zn-dependent protease
MRPNRGIDLFRVGGVQIAIDFSWLVIFLLVIWSLAVGYFPRLYPGYGAEAYWGIGLVATLLFFASVVVHELAHALVANHHGQPVRRITLFIFGGMAHLSREPRNPSVELQIAAVGPLTSLVLGGVFWLAHLWSAQADLNPLVVAMFRYLAIINVALAVFNLLPGFPLDGGRILRAVLWMRSGNLRQATARAADWGSGIGFGVMALGVLQIFGGALIGGLWLIFIGMFLRGAARASYQSVVVEHALSEASVRDLMVREPVVVPSNATVSQVVEEHFLRHGFGGYPVRGNGRIEGIVSLHEIRQVPPDERPRRAVRDIMRPAEGRVTIPATAPVSDALRQMVEAETGRLLVTEGGNIVGLITQTGIARFIQIRSQLETGEEAA